MRFVDLFAGLGGFHLALRELHHECVFASENNEELRALYRENFPEMGRPGRVGGDITEPATARQVPTHDILCAGFPCQPFSKSGYQAGWADKTRGTLFGAVLAIVRTHHPRFVILENVGNFERHDDGRTWSTVRGSLEREGYDVRGTEHVRSGGHGLVSPHHLGYPHTRERFFVVASRGSLPPDPFPPADRTRVTSLADIVQPEDELTEADRAEVRLAAEQIRCIEHWNRLIRMIPESIPLPSFPIWGDEVKAQYPFEAYAPHSAPLSELRRCVSGNGPGQTSRRAVLASLNLPRYAVTGKDAFPKWKADFIRQNREWFRLVKQFLPRGWVKDLRTFALSHRKLEWNCKGARRDLWSHVLQFRPSGLRVKRYQSCPALVALTTTQVPILGPQRRYITRIEGLRLQGFSDDHRLPATRRAAFRALGNAVHVKVVQAIAERLLPKGGPQGLPQEARRHRP